MIGLLPPVIEAPRKVCGGEVGRLSAAEMISELPADAITAISHPYRPTRASLPTNLKNAVTLLTDSWLSALVDN
jgi:hypothetical protein